MPTTKSKKVKTKTASKGFWIWTFFIYVLLAGAVTTYFLPIVRVTVPSLGHKSWSARDITETIPKVQPPKEGERPKFSHNFDFIDFVKEVAPRGKTTQEMKDKYTIIILGALIPVALALAYLAVVAGLFLAPLKKGGLFLFTCGLTTVCASYVFVGVRIVNTAAQGAFQQAIEKAESNPFFLVTKHFVKEVSIQPDWGLLTFAVVAGLIFMTALLRQKFTRTASS
jgi:hypothetical protein